MFLFLQNRCEPHDTVECNCTVPGETEDDVCCSEYIYQHSYNPGSFLNFLLYYSVIKAKEYFDMDWSATAEILGIILVKRLTADVYGHGRAVWGNLSPLAGCGSVSSAAFVFGNQSKWRTAGFHKRWGSICLWLIQISHFHMKIFAFCRCVFRRNQQIHSKKWFEGAELFW